jgi:pyruvate carboxylase subunit B
MPPELEKAKAEAHKLGIVKTEEDVVTYALYPQVATKFLRGELKEEALPTMTATAPAAAGQAAGPLEFSVDVDGEVFTVKVSAVGGRKIAEAEKAKPKEMPKGAIVAPMQGMVLTVKAKPGDKVAEGDVLLIIEAMKMRNEVRSASKGIVKEVLTHDGEVVNGGDVLMVVVPE